jgi:hypothetical protein
LNQRIALLLSTLCLFCFRAEGADPQHPPAPISTNDFMVMCKSVVQAKQESQANYERSPCAAYVVGFLESAGFLTYLAKIEPRYCLPVGVDPARVIKLAATLSRKHPELTDRPAAFLLRSTLEKSFPCRESTRH